MSAIDTTAIARPPATIEMSSSSVTSREPERRQALRQRPDDRDIVRGGQAEDAGHDRRADRRDQDPGDRRPPAAERRR